MRLSFVTTFLAGAMCLTLFSGCGYVHFGRYKTPPASGSSELASENSDLRMEKKVLKQELLLAQKEGQALRDALETQKSGGSDSSQLARQLQEAHRELSSLRDDYTRLQTERARLSQSANPANNFEAVEQIAQLKTQLRIAEGKTDQALDSFAKLQRENAQLREEVSRVRSTNAGLVQQVQTLTQQNEDVTAALSQLNSELLAQTDARRRAEEQSTSYQSQLQLILSRQSSDGTTLTSARQSGATSADDLDASLRMSQARTTSAPPTAVLRTSPERLRQTATNTPAVRYHIVAEGETLETISKRYYGRTQAWRTIYAANNDQLRGGRKLKVGMKLVIPE